MSADEERTAFDHGYAAAVADTVLSTFGGQPVTKDRELAYDRWVRLGRDLERYLGDEEWLPRDE